MSEMDRFTGQADGESLQERRDVASEIASRLRTRGVQLTGQETDEQLIRILESVERFEATVERHGGDLMVDEPVRENDTAHEPDNRRFVLPRRERNESVDAFIERVARATERAREP